MAAVFITSADEGLSAGLDLACQAVSDAGHSPTLPAPTPSAHADVNDNLHRARYLLLLLGNPEASASNPGSPDTTRHVRTAQQAGKEILVLAREPAGEPTQSANIARMADFADGHFRGPFSTPDSLSGMIGVGLRYAEGKGDPSAQAINAARRAAELGPAAQAVVGTTPRYGRSTGAEFGGDVYCAGGKSSLETIARYIRTQTREHEVLQRLITDDWLEYSHAIGGWFYDELSLPDFLVMQHVINGMVAGLPGTIPAKSGSWRTAFCAVVLDFRTQLDKRIEQLQSDHPRTS